MKCSLSIATSLNWMPLRSSGQPWPQTSCLSLSGRSAPPLGTTHMPLQCWILNQPSESASLLIMRPLRLMSQPSYVTSSVSCEGQSEPPLGWMHLPLLRYCRLKKSSPTVVIGFGIGTTSQTSGFLWRPTRPAFLPLTSGHLWTPGVWRIEMSSHTPCSALPTEDLQHQPCVIWLTLTMSSSLEPTRRRPDRNVPAGHVLQPPALSVMVACQSTCSQSQLPDWPTARYSTPPSWCSPPSELADRALMTPQLGTFSKRG
mmetsp:Transcript_21124/g.47004  ORF Transcript_21124/g.47004 Transcript_21124/m.47004 type:complete len:258 (+) Transcript_21124:2304-3077(+)